MNMRGKFSHIWLKILKAGGWCCSSRSLPIIDHPHSRSFSACDGWCSWQCHCHHIRSHYVVPPKPGALPEAQNIVTVISFSGRERQWRSYWYTREPVDQVIFWRKNTPVNTTVYPQCTCTSWLTLVNRYVDPGLSLMLVLLILKSVWPLLIESALILLQVYPHMLHMVWCDWRLWCDILVQQPWADCLFRLCLELKTTFHWFKSHKQQWMLPPQNNYLQSYP